LARAVRLRPFSPPPARAIDLPTTNRPRSSSKLGTRPVRLGRGGWLRPALAWCGVVIALQSVEPLVFGSIDGAPTHVARHVRASASALARGLRYAAGRPRRAFGLLPLVAALLATTIVGAVLDTASGARSPWAETVHVSEIAGTVLLWLV